MYLLKENKLIFVNNKEDSYKGLRFVKTFLKSDHKEIVYTIVETLEYYCLLDENKKKQIPKPDMTLGDIVVYLLRQGFKVYKDDKLVEFEGFEGRKNNFILSHT